MTTFSEPDDLSGATFTDVDLRGARFVRSDLSGVVMRAAELGGADLDAPWLLDGGSTLLVNGVDVAPLVDAELDRRFPGREQRRAEDPDGLRAAWDAVERTWGATVERVAAMPAGTPDVSVDGEWSFAQTLRHLVMATDTWLGGAILGLEAPYHPIGQPNAEYAADGYDPAVFATGVPSYDDVLGGARREAGPGARAARRRHRCRPRRGAPQPVVAGVRSGDRPARACTRSWGRSGSTSATPSATSTRSRAERRPPLGSPEWTRRRVPACGAGSGSASLTPPSGSCCRHRSACWRCRQASPRCRRW